MNLQTRINIEKQIAKKTIEVLLATDKYMLRIHDGEAFATKLTENATEVYNAMFRVDEERIWVYDKETKIATGDIYFVYGNDGYDVINDYTTNLEEVLKPVMELAEKLEKKHG